ncbi:MAG: hypothetical protein DRH97_01130, partial [Chloroflexi bacterium]
MRGELFIRILVAAILGIGGWRLATVIAETNEAASELTWILSLAIGAYVCGFLLAPYIAIRPWRWARKRVRNARRLLPINSVIAAAIGLAFALVITALITLPLSMLPGRWGQITPIVAAVFLICLFVPIMLLQGPAVLQFFFSGSPSLSRKREDKSDFIILD